MKLHGADWAVMAVIASAGCVAIYIGLERVLRRAVRERQRDMERQLNAMATTVKALQARVAELSRQQAARVTGEVPMIAAPAETAREPEAGTDQAGDCGRADGCGNGIPGQEGARALGTAAGRSAR